MDPLKGTNEELRLHLLLYKSSAEKYIHMSQMEEEKRAFKKLIDMKPNLFIDLKDYKIEDQMKQLDIIKNQDKNTRQGGV